MSILLGTRDAQDQWVPNAALAGTVDANQWVFADGKTIPQPAS